MKSNRRQFLAVTGAGATAAWMPTIIPSRAFGANDRVRTGHIGVRNQGTNNLKELLKNKNVDVVAVCDVDSDVLAKAAKLVQDSKKEPIKAEKDFRVLLNDKSIDAVVVTTPDHWHAIPTIEACMAGKDVYCEKPLSLFMTEGQAMVEAARKYNRVVQTGTQQRSDKRFRQAVEIVRSGLLGRIERIRVGIPGVNFTGPAVADSTPPANLDYDRWLGPAPKKAYNEKHVHYLFRFFWDYSGGQMTNFGAHHLDIVQWALNMDNSGPLEIIGTGQFHKDNWYEVPEKFEVTYTYEGNLKVIAGQDQPPGGVVFEGANGDLYVTRSKITCDKNPDILKAEIPKESRVTVSDNHFQNWVDCIKSREKPIADVAIGHRSATVCHLGNIAVRTGRKLLWNAEREFIQGDDEAQAMLSRPYREPWELKRNI
jgi:predicted dehydrogenase